VKKTFDDPLFGNVSLPIFDGFPYLVTQVVANLNHYLLLPRDASPSAPVAFGLRQVHANRLRSCVVLAGNHAVYIGADLSTDESDSPPAGGFPFTGKLRPHWTLPATKATRERARELDQHIERHRIKGYLTGDLGMGGREASGEELRRLGGSLAEDVPTGLAPCVSCNDYSGECLHQHPEYRGCVIKVFCSCDNWNRCASCGAKLADRRLNAPFWEVERGAIVYVPGFACVNHMCA
jgi:hypothetical protein